MNRGTLTHPKAARSGWKAYDNTSNATAASEIAWAARTPDVRRRMAVELRVGGELQEALGRQILLENVSSYVAFRESTISEWEFIGEVARRADCGILLDVNNIYVSARNHGFSAAGYIAGVPADRIAQFHLAGHSDKGAYLFDSHDAQVPESVWDLYRIAVARFGPVPWLIEWDDHIPELEVLVGESRKAAAIEAEALGRRAVAS